MSKKDPNQTDTKLYFKRVFGAEFEYPKQKYAPGIHSELESLRHRFEAGENICLLEAVAFCAVYGILMPEWAAWEFHERWTRIPTYDAKSLDEAFGAPFPAKTHVEAKRREFEMSFTVFREVKRRVESDEKISEELFESVGRKYGLSMSLTRKWYYKFKKTYGM